MPSQPPRVQFNFEEPVNEETGEVNPNFIYKDDLKLELQDDIEEEIIEDEPKLAVKVPDIKRKEIITADVFDIPSLAVMPEEVKEVLEKQTPIPKKQPKLKKNGEPRKAMSEEHKQKLAIAREKAKIGRQAAIKRRQEESARKIEEKELLKKKKEIEFVKLKKEVEEGEAPTPPPQPIQHIQQGYTQEQMEQATYSAIAQYEILRKQRKEEKRRAEAIEREKQEVINKLKPATGYRARLPNGRLANIYDSCY